jgi:hypothetical protein
MAEDEARGGPPADEGPGPAEQSSQKPDGPVELSEVEQRGVDFLTSTVAPVDKFRPELDAPADSTGNQGGAEGGPVDEGGDQGGE